MTEHTDPMENAPQHAASDPETADDATAAETVPGADDTAAKKARREDGALDTDAVRTKGQEILSERRHWTKPQPLDLDQGAGRPLRSPKPGWGALFD